MKKVLKGMLFIFHAAEWLVITAAVFIVILMLLGIHPYAVKTGSMEPAIRMGSLCFVNQRTAFEDIREGDIIAFRSGELLVTHRAVSIGGNGITTKGDANNTEDALEITKEQYIGKTLFWLPEIGKVLLFCQTKRGKAVGAAIVLFLVIVALCENRMTKKRSETENESDV